MSPTDFQEIDIREYLNDVRTGRFSEEINAFRESKGQPKDVRTRLKNRIPAVTISGTFNEKVANANLKQHSGFICIDFDHVENISDFKTTLENDQYTYSVLYSASGEGLAALVRIDANRHADAYNGLKNYYFRTYTQLIDKSCSNVSRLRFLSIDQNLFINQKAKVFKEYPKKEREPKSFATVLTGNEFEQLIQNIVTSGKDLTSGEYQNYLTIGFALASEFHEGGRRYFHAICSQNSKYEEKNCDKQFTYCIRDGGATKIRIGSFYHLAKMAGIELKSKQSYQLENISKMAKKQSRSKDSVVKIAQDSGLDVQLAEEVATAVFEKNVSLEMVGETQAEIIQLFLQSNYRIRFNVITNNFEDRNVLIDGLPKIINDMELNTMFINLTTSTEGQKISFDYFTKYIFSEYIEQYNPFFEFFQEAKNVQRSTALIEQLADCINTDTPNVLKWLTQWGVGIISSAHGIYSPLVLVLAGERQNTGKTEFFRRLLPTALQPYYAESKLDMGKDDDILMCKKLVIMDDEFGGKSKQEARRLKELTSKQSFSIRLPYGRSHKEMKRISVLCGTTNDLNLISDPTGNRRIVPINVLSIDHAKYNAIDKNALFMAFYDLYKSGYKWQFTSADIELLKQSSDNFIATNPEAELIDTHFMKPNSEYDGEYMTNTQIKNYIETNSAQRIFNYTKLGAELKNMGFNQVLKRIGSTVARTYHVKKRNENIMQSPPPENLPF